MASIRNLKDPSGNVFYPLTHERAVKDSNGVSLETKLAGLESKSYVEAWDGASTPVVANIPAGVTVTYNTTTYTGTLAASESTVGKVYLVKNGNDYDRYITSQSGSSYSWVPNGSTAMDLSGYATDAELGQLQQKVEGNVLLTYTGAQGFVNFTEVTQDTNVIISVSGDTTALRQLAFLQGWTAKLTISGFNNWKKIKTTIPAGSNKLGIYEVTGQTLANITITIKTESISESLLEAEENIDDLWKAVDSSVKGASADAELSGDEKDLISAIKVVEYNDPDNQSPVYIRLFGFYSDHIQMTVTPDKTTMYDFSESAGSRPTGVKTYNLTNGSKTLFLVFDWDKFGANFGNTDYHLVIDKSDVSYIINPIANSLQTQIDEIKEEQGNVTEVIGFDGATNEQSVANTVICPVKKVTKNGVIKSIYLKSQNAGKVTLYVGEVDQLLLFIARQSYEINVSAGEQTIDVSDMDIYVFAGEQVALKTNGNRYLIITDGAPESDESFYYGDTYTGLQLQAYTVGTKKIQFSFKVTISENDLISLKAEVDKNTAAINNLTEEVGYIKSNMNVVSDISGNKYRMMVVDGDLHLFPLNFSHVLAVGNSYTIHPTTDDSALDLANSLWWGHWAMAASRKETSWTTLLQTALRQKINSAKVTPVFGRRYETGIRNLTDNDAFIYWEDDQWKNLKPNVSSFADVDCVLFFLGDNYTAGSGWYDIYKPMVLQFAQWFPNATIVCCSCRVREANNDAIAQVATEVSAVYVSMYALGGSSKLGNYVSGDDGNLHQIDNSAVAGHFGDYGEWLILDRIVRALGYENNATLYNIAITNPTGVTLSVKDSKTVAGAIVSVFADIASGSSLSGISVTSGGNAVSVTDHGVTDYGRIFTFTMPSGDVTITGA